MDRIDEKEYQYLLKLMSVHDKKMIYDFVKGSEMYMTNPRRKVNGQYRYDNVLLVKSDPEIFHKYYPLIDHFKSEIFKMYNEIAGGRIYDVTLKPELSKFQILHNSIIPVVTPWEEINNLQNALLKDLRTTSTLADFNNIGNSSRMIMQLLSNTVFDPFKHKAEGVDLKEDKFKNRLHTYIKIELESHQQEKLRKYIDSIIETTEKGIDLMNKVTHDSRADNFYAESCVIGVVTTIGLIKLVHNMPKA